MMQWYNQPSFAYFKYVPFRCVEDLVLEVVLATITMYNVS